MRPIAALVAVGLVLGPGCAGPEDSPDVEPVPTEAPVVVPPPLDPGSLDQVTAVAVDGELVLLGGEPGIVVLDPATGEYRLLGDDEGPSLRSVAALAVTASGVLWSAHHVSDASDSRRSGGVRAVPATDGPVRAWHAEDGLATDDVPALAATDDWVVAATGAGVAVLRPAEEEVFAQRFPAGSRRLDVITFDGNESSRREVFEFQPRGEQALSVALDGDRLWIGTTHGLYRLDLVTDSLARWQVPCRLDHRVPRRVEALAPRGDGGVVAVLALEEPSEPRWRPAGLLELIGERDHRCHVPDVDVPASPALAVDHRARTTWLATYEGPTVIRDRDAELLDAAAGAPAFAATAIAADGGGGAWIGTWGGGAWHLRERSYRSYRFGASPEGVATTTEGRLR